jgi:hypothetical protein
MQAATREPPTVIAFRSFSALRVGDVFHSTYPPGAFSWLDHYQPAAKVGKTIQLYYVPDN